MVDAVDTFRRIAWLISKWLFYVVAAIVAIFFAIIGLTYCYQWYSHDRHEAKVAFSIFASKSSICKDDKHPIFVGIVNNSGRTIESVSFTLKANRPDRSSNLVRYHSYSDDKIIKPTEGFGNCWAVPELTETVADPRELEWGTLYKSVNFRD
ncbi:hypothetical protein [Pseudorhodoplanes sp.]|uniref:hypothetical protein n=1 Tax=Pseudorhodoplanes sp. TaxID=1934341 RepID=UPI003D0CC5A9